MKKAILVVDDMPNIRQSLKELLQDEGYFVATGGSGEQTLQILAETHFDILFLDVKLPGIDGLTTLKRLQQLQPRPKVIMISGEADLEMAVQATQLGAYNFLEKPLKPEKVLLEVKNIFDRQQVESEVQQLKTIADLEYRMIGNSPAMQKLRGEIELAAPSDSRILIFGENGTGKELVAREIHLKSRRADKAFLKINCAAIPRELIESELFGHEKGSFTGAIRKKIGVFEEANGGTLLLDEVGDMALETQAKLLRVLQENEFTRVGGTATIPFNVRIVSATNKDLKAQIAEGFFREDLFFRINVIPLRVPPLRERPEDIPSLVHHFLKAYSQKNGKKVKEINRDALQPLIEYDWKGNIRELRNFIERLVIMTESPRLTRTDVAVLLPELKSAVDAGTPLNPTPDPLEALSLKDYQEHFEKQLLQKFFQKYQGNVSRLAEALKTDRANLHRKLKKYGIKS